MSGRLRWPGKTPLVLRVSERCSAGGWGICADLGQEEIGSRKKGKEKEKEKEKEDRSKKEKALRL